MARELGALGSPRVQTRSPREGVRLFSPFRIRLPCSRLPRSLDPLLPLLLGISIQPLILVLADRVHTSLWKLAGEG